jgi:hypothetical protein
MKRRFRGLVWSLVSVPAYVVTTRAKGAETEPVPPPLAGLIADPFVQKERPRNPISNA